MKSGFAAFLIFLVYSSAASSECLDETDPLENFSAEMTKIAEKSELLDHNCAESAVVTADKSPNLALFKSLQKKGMRASVDELMTLWYPDEGELDDAYFFKCQEGNDSLTARLPHEALVPTNCTPDVLYSWGPSQKIANMSMAMKDGAIWINSPNPRDGGIGNLNGKEAVLFTTVSPASTMGYGEEGIRIKLKSSAKFRNRVWKPSKGEVSVSPSDTFHDIVINDSQIIESWSSGTPEQYDEIVRDIKRIISNKKAVVYCPMLSNQEERKGWMKFFVELDGNALNENVLKERLLHHIDKILGGKARIFYQDGSCRNRKLHFKTDKPTYFNPH